MRLRGRTQHKRRHEHVAKLAAGEEQHAIDVAPHYVYRLYDRTGELLYVGVTSHIETRIEHHRSESGWFPLVADGRVTVCETRLHAEIVEREWIIYGRPKFTKSAKPTTTRLALYQHAEGLKAILAARDQ